MAARVPIFVCGEPERGDDAAGFAAVEAFRMRAGEIADLAEIVPVGRLDAAHLLDLPDGLGCVVVDAVAGLAPGELWVRPLAMLSPRQGSRAPRPVRSSHMLPVDGAVALATVLRGAPPAGLFIGIGGASFDLGAPVSPAVSAGIVAAAAAITDAVVRLAHAARAGGPASAKMSPPSGGSGRETRPVPAAPVRNGRER